MPLSHPHSTDGLDRCLSYLLQLLLWLGPALLQAQVHLQAPVRSLLHLLLQKVPLSHPHSTDGLDRCLSHLLQLLLRLGLALLQALARSLAPVQLLLRKVPLSHLHSTDGLDHCLRYLLLLLLRLGLVLLQALARSLAPVCLPGSRPASAQLPTQPASPVLLY